MTDVDPTEIAKIEAQASGGGSAVAGAKRRLAGAVTELYHGAAASGEAAARFDAVHVAHEIPSDVEEVSIPAGALRQTDLVWLPAVLAGLGLASSNSEARRLLAQGGVRLDGEPVTEEELPASALAGRVLQVGRRRFVRVTG